MLSRSILSLALLVTALSGCAQMPTPPRLVLEGYTTNLTWDKITPFDCIGYSASGIEHGMREYRKSGNYEHYKMLLIHKAQLGIFSYGQHIRELPLHFNYTIEELTSGQGLLVEVTCSGMVDKLGEALPIKVKAELEDAYKAALAQSLIDHRAWRKLANANAGKNPPTQ